MPNQSAKQKVTFSFESPVTLRDRNPLKDFLVGVFRKEHVLVESLSYVFCSDEYLLEINRGFLKHDYFTDIITFNLASPGEPVAGEIYISVDRVRDNAFNLGEPFYRELHRVIFHGALHLCGYKDKSRAEILKMRAAEERNLQRYFK